MNMFRGVVEVQAAGEAARVAIASTPQPAHQATHDAADQTDHSTAPASNVSHKKIDTARSG
jgi:plastocyanin domain-containing protein